MLALRDTYTALERTHGEIVRVVAGVEGPVPENVAQEIMNILPAVAMAARKLREIEWLLSDEAQQSAPPASESLLEHCTWHCECDA